jgi:hypothetical protein
MGTLEDFLGETVPAVPAPQIATPITAEVFGHDTTGSVGAAGGTNGAGVDDTLEHFLQDARAQKDLESGTTPALVPMEQEVATAVPSVAKTISLPLPSASEAQVSDQSPQAATGPVGTFATRIESAESFELSEPVSGDIGEGSNGRDGHCSPCGSSEGHFPGGDCSPCGSSEGHFPGGAGQSEPWIILREITPNTEGTAAQQELLDDWEVLNR